MSILQQFSYQGTPVRTVLVNGEPWFVAADACQYFGVTNRNRVMQGVDAEDKGGTQTDTPGGTQTLTTVNESGLYSILFALQPAKARGVSATDVDERVEKLRKFKRWVTHEVLPQIRTTGTYGLPRSLPEALRAYAAEVEAHHAAQKRIAVLEPKAHTWETLASAAGDLSVRDAAQVLCRDHRIGIGQNRLFTYLREAHRPWLDRNSRPYQWAVDASLVAEKLQHFTIQRTQGAVLAPPQVRLTAKGLERLRTELTKKPTHQTPAAAHSAGTLTQV